MNMNINIRYILVSLAVILGLCTGCSDDAAQGTGTDPVAGLTLRVPMANRFGSRAPGDNADELNYTSLHLFAFPESGEAKIISLPTDNSPVDFVDTYRDFPIKLNKGKYRFFIVANIFAADADASTLPQTETALKNEIISYAADYNCMIPDKGLPMSGIHTDFFVRNSDGTTTSFSDSEPFDYTGQSASIYAVMTFACAKVTIVAKDAGEKPERITDAGFVNLSQSEPLLFFNQTYNYGNLASVTPDTQEYDSAEETPESISFYIPERYVTEAAQGSSMTMKINDKEIALPLGEMAGTEPGETHLVPAMDDLRSIRRGSHYRYTLVTTDKINLEVLDWTPEQIAAELNGPVYLHVEKQVYEVTAGEETAIWFDSDADDVHVKSPKYTYNGKDLDLFEYSIDATQDSIRVWVNPSIPTSEYEEVKRSVNAHEGKYDFIHIIAGPINKKITIYPLNLDRYLQVSPTTVPIDVKLRVASGEYSGTIPVNIRTNYPQVKVKLVDGWGVISADESDALQVVSTAGNVVTAGGGVTTDIESGRATYNINFAGLNSGYNVWKDDYTFTFSVVGVDESGNENGEPQIVTITIAPSLLDYKIHFKADGWTLPHIYVYQCLEFPADYNQIFDGESLASRPIGYADGESRFAALEYSFACAVAFRGWNYPLNYNLIYNPDGTMKTFIGSFSQGFYIFNSAGAADWNPSAAQQSPRYNFDMDFCREHRDYVSVEHAEYPGIYCEQCAWGSPTMNRTWPGIMMKPEGDGWYEFDLTGVATPGKTRIMFANTHNGSGVQRYPGDAQVGIPLFDYPTREGWLYFNGAIDDRVGNQFSSTKPDAPTTPTVSSQYLYRIYWPVSTGWNQVHIWFWGGDQSYPDATNWNESGFPTGTVNGYNYYDFETYAPQNTYVAGIIFHGGRDGQYQLKTDGYGDGNPLARFTANAAIGRNCAYYNPDNNTLVSGVPN